MHSSKRRVVRSDSVSLDNKYFDEIICKKPLAIEVPRKSLVETRRIKCLENGGRHFRNILGALLGHEATEKRCKEKLAAAAPAISLGALRILCFCMLLCV